MSTGIFAVGVLNFHLIKFRQHDLAIVMSDIFLSTHRHPKLFYVIVDGCRILFHECILRIGQGGIVRKPARAEYTEIGKLLVIADTRIQRL